MSLIFSNEIGCIISHSNFITNVYHNTTRENNTIGKFRLRDDLFKITHPFKQICNYAETVEIPESPKKRKLKRKYRNLDPLVTKVKDAYEGFIQSARSADIFPTEDPAARHEANEDARRAAEECSTASIVLSSLGNISGGNTAPTALFQHLHNKCDILLPANCRFICGDVRTTLPKLDGEKFDLVILDPPWWNKYIRRSKAKKPESSYQMLYNEEIANLSLSGLLSSGALVGVWCTNCAAHEQAIKRQMFPTWGVQYVATWFWLKVTEVGGPVCPFTELNGKQPFERIIIGIHEKFPNQPSPPKDRIILSVPSALHSHKPPLNDVLAPFLALESGNKCLEIFARYLLPNTTSVGLEPLKWQHSSLYFEDTENSEPEI